MNTYCNCADCRVRPLADRWHDDNAQLSFNDLPPSPATIAAHDQKVIERMRLRERFGTPGKVVKFGKSGKSKPKGSRESQGWAKSAAQNQKALG